MRRVSACSMNEWSKRKECFVNGRVHPVGVLSQGDNDCFTNLQRLLNKLRPAKSGGKNSGPHPHFLDLDCRVCYRCNLIGAVIRGPAPDESTSDPRQS